MAQFVNIFPVELNTEPASVSISAYEGDANSLRVGAQVTDGGAYTALGGSCVGKVIRADGATVPLTGTISGNLAYVVLDQTCCAVEGPIEVSVIWVSGGNKTTLLKAYGTVIRTETGNSIQPSTPIPDLTELLAEIDEMRAATAAANAAANGALTNFAGAFSDATAYTASQYVTYTDGYFYRFKVDHAAGVWSSSEVERKTAADVFTELFRNLNDAQLSTVTTSIPIVNADGWINKNINDTTGQETTGESTKIICTGFYPLDESTEMTFTGVIRGEGETVDRSYYTYCYSENKAYLGRTNRALISGTKFVRFTYGFVSDSPNTISSYGKANLIVDWGMNFVPTYLSRLSTLESDVSGLDTRADGIDAEIDAIQAEIIRDAISASEISIPEVGNDDWEIGTLNSSTGEEQDSTRIIRTGYYPINDGTEYQFAGVLQDVVDSQTYARLDYVYYYNSAKEFIGRGNRAFPVGTRFVRFTYGFSSSSGLTVEGYREENLIADWAAVFTPGYKKVDDAFSGLVSSLENREWFSPDLDLGAFLQFEKLECLHHDNFARADSANDIGYNGTNQTVYNVPPLKMEYGSLSIGSLNVGINSNSAVSTGGSTGDITIKTVNPGTLPYKIMASVTYQGEIAVGIKNINEFVSIQINRNSVSMIDSGSKSIWVSRSTSHYSGVPVYEIYVYADKIVVYNCGAKMFEAPANIKTALCGIVFRKANNAGESLPYAYTCFDVFTPSTWMRNGLDRAIETYSESAFNPASDSAVNTRNSNAAKTFGQLQTAMAYGITIDNTVTEMSKKALRFELRYGDTIVSSGARAEIVPIRPKGNVVNLHSNILDFDVYFGSDYDSDSGEDIIMQMHDLPDGVNLEGLSPGIALKIVNNTLYLSTMGKSTKVLSAADKPIQKLTSLMTVEKGKWFHITLYLREGYMEMHDPVVAVWIDGKLVTIDRGLNAYNETRGSYPKFGIYKSWMHGPTQTSKRTLWIDNINLWY